MADNDEALEKDLLKVYEKFYFSELERSEKLTARMSILLTIYTLLVGGAGFFLSNLPVNGAAGLIVWFYPALGGEIIALLFSLRYAAAFLLYNNYAFTLPAQGIEDFVSYLKKTNASARDRYIADTGRPSIDIKSEMTGWLKSQYVEAATMNFEENNRKLGALANALRSVTLAVLLGILTALPYFIIKQMNMHAPSRVEHDKTQYG